MIDDFSWETQTLSFNQEKTSPADYFVTVLSVSFRNWNRTSQQQNQIWSKVEVKWKMGHFIQHGCSFPKALDKCNEFCVYMKDICHKNRHS